jgi:hypothetical protein
MKLIKKIIPVLIMLFIAVPGFSSETTPAVANTSPSEVAARTEVLTNRLNEIKAMDIESMTRKEKRTLRKEVKAIEKEIEQTNSRGVYISVGGIIIIILLLILLL